MSTVEVFSQSNPASHEVADVISVLDHSSPELYRVEWESASRDYNVTYEVEEFRFGNGPQMKLLGNKTPPAEYLIDSNPPGQPQVVHLRKDGYQSESRLVDLRILSEKVHWRHQIQRISGDIKRKLMGPSPE